MVIQTLLRHYICGLHEQSASSSCSLPLKERAPSRRLAADLALTSPRARRTARTSGWPAP
jgi:hypothetical protein